MKKFTKSKKIVAILLLICLAFVMVGCTTGNNLDKDGNYIVDDDSTCAKIVGTILDGLHYALQYIHLYNYIFAIILLTLLVKIATTPLNVKQQKSMKSMQAIQPKMMELNKKYADNPQKKQQEVAKLYSEEKISPLSGCLPMFIQMPILFILFYGMRNWVPDQSIIDAGLYSFLWIPDLSMTVKLTPYPWFLPIACAVVTMFQQYMSTTNMQDTSQKMMLFMMPIMFLFITQQFPSALAVYWMFYGLFTMLQTTFLNYKYKAGFFAPPEVKARKTSMFGDMREKEQERKNRLEAQQHTEEKAAKHEATHNMSQKNADVISKSQGRKQDDQRDKPWH